MSNSDDKAHQHLATMAPLTTWLSLLLENGYVAPKYWGKLARILTLTTSAVPLRFAEWMRYRLKVTRTTLDKPPIIILGFPRSGTTHLHNLMWQDPQYGAVSTFQAGMPNFFLIGRGWLKRRIENSMPDTRPMDNVQVSLDMPQEEEIAMVNSCRISALWHLSFPNNARKYFDKYAMMERLTKRELARWDRCYRDILHKATIDNNGLQLVLKSPANTGRIFHLLRLFPRAKFIHIVRNPCDVYQSMTNLYRKVLPLYQLQDMNAEDMGAHVVYMYQKMMQQYLKDRSLIAEGDLAEVRFEDLDQQPLAEMERLYTTLGLSGWEDGGKQAIVEYLSTLSDYQKNTFEPDPDAMAHISQAWRFAFEEWNYELPVKL